MSQQFSDVIASAVAIRNQYNELQVVDGNKVWNAQDRTAGLVGDVGDLSKLVMAKHGLRRGPQDIDAALEHELSDCLWSALIIADELDIDIETAFTKWTKEMHMRIEREKGEV